MKEDSLSKVARFHIETVILHAAGKIVEYDTWCSGLVGVQREARVLPPFTSGDNMVLKQ